MHVRSCSRAEAHELRKTGVGREPILRYRKWKWTSPAVQKAPAWDRRPAGRPSSPGRPPPVTRRPEGRITSHRSGHQDLPGVGPGFQPLSPGL